MNSINRTMTRLLLLLSGSVLIAACSDSDNASIAPPVSPPPPPPALATFEVSVTNLTNAQPLSPLAVIAHLDGYAVFAIGSPASDGLEMMAEGGDNSVLLAEADDSTEVLATGSGAAAIGPGGTETVTVDVVLALVPNLNFSVATMLVNTNDAFSGLNAASVANMAIGDTVSMAGIAYDAGTEADTESAATIPGPAGGGEGFNAARDDMADQVAMHSGVVSMDDGLATSDLAEQHRFDNPVALVRITRIN